MSNTTPLMDRTMKVDKRIIPADATLGRMRPKRQPPGALDREHDEEVRRTDEARAKQYAEVQRQFQVALAANAPMIKAMFATLTDMCEGWFSGMQGFDEPNFHGDCMLAVTELAEAVEADRTDSMSDKVPEFHGRDEEIADALVRLFHLCGKYELKIGPAFIAKMQMNLQRPFKHGKQY